MDIRYARFFLHQGVQSFPVSFLSHQYSSWAIFRFPVEINDASQFSSTLYHFVTPLNATEIVSLGPQMEIAVLKLTTPGPLLLVSLGNGMKHIRSW